MTAFRALVACLQLAAVSACGAMFVLPIYFSSRADLYLWSLPNVLKLVAAPLSIGGILLVAVIRGREARINAGLAIVFTIFSLYVVEAVLQIAGPAAFYPPSFDKRTKLEVVAELREAGRRTFPSIASEKFLAVPLDVEGEPVVPLSGMANAVTVLCNEVGEFYIYESDQHGFTNPASAWDGARIALIGDSFTQGLCQPGGKAYAELLRSSVPGVLNLGMNGNGPLAELATIREYAARVAPEKVVWFYFEGNDFDDLSSELRSPVLPRYLEDSKFTQSLVERSESVQTALASFIEEKMFRETDPSWAGRLERARKSLPRDLKLGAKLWETRVKLGLTDLRREWPLKTWRPPALADSDLQTAFRTALARASTEVASWGGRLYFVYLPSHRSFKYDIEHPWRSRVLETAKSLGLPILDMREVMGKQGDPLAMYPYRLEGHFSAEGNRLVAESLKELIGEGG